MVAEMSFRKLDAPQLVAKVASGTKYDNGNEVGQPLSSFYTPIDNSSLAALIDLNAYYLVNGLLILSTLV